MNTTTRTLAGLAVASAAVTVALAAPATAMPLPNVPSGAQSAHHPSSQGHANLVNARVAEYQRTHELGAAPAPQTPTSTLITTDSGVQWDQVAYGAAAGIALTTAAGASLIVVRRRQHLAH